MQKLKSEKGITLIALAITIVVLSLISVPVLINASKVSGIKRYSLFKSDIDTLREAIDVAYANDYNIASIGPKYTGDLSVLNGTQNGVKIKNDNDNNNYYVIDVTKLNEKASTTMQELNFGSENNAVAGKTTYTGGTDVYIVNEKSKTIYYVQGLTYKGKTYYRLSENFTEITETIKPGEYVTEFNKAFIDKYGSKAMIPVGYAVSTVESEQIVADGLVIKDKSGNEFVWIPTTKFVDKNYNTVVCGYKRAAFGNQKVVADDQETESRKIKNKEIDQYYFIEAMPSQERLSVMENMGFYIGIGGSDEVQGHRGTITAIHFDAKGECENFNGKTVANGKNDCDTRFKIPGRVESLSARYILDGTDKNGNPCRIYVENNGVDNNGMTTEPTIITDSPDYAWVETAPLHGTVSWEKGLTIHMWTTADAMNGK